MTCPKCGGVLWEFEEGDLVRYRCHVGRGLGLAGMRERVEAIGGRLQVESEPDVGTTLTVRVPLSS